MRRLLLAAVLLFPALGRAEAPPSSAPPLESDRPEALAAPAQTPVVGGSAAPSAGATSYGADRVRFDIPIGRKAASYSSDRILEAPLVRGGIDDRPYLLRLGSGSTNVAIGGYFDLVASYLQTGGVSDGFSAEARRFNIFITSKIADRIRLTSELEFEHGTEEISLETALADILLHHAINLRAGILLAPIGKFNIAHDSPLYDVVDRPLVSTLIIPATLSDLGGGLFGSFYPGGHKLTYEIYVVNGLQDGVIAANGTSIPGGKAGNRFEEDNNGQPSITARIGYATPPRRKFQLDIGVSYYGGAYNTFMKEGRRIDDPRWLHIVAYDLETITGPVTMRGEAAYAHIDLPPGLPAVFASNQFGFYWEVVGTFLKRKLLMFDRAALAAVTRLDYVDLNLDGLGQKTWRLTLGLSFRPAPGTSLRAGYYHEWPTDTLNNLHNGGGIQLGIATYY